MLTARVSKRHLMPNSFERATFVKCNYLSRVKSTYQLCMMSARLSVSVTQSSFFVLSPGALSLSRVAVTSLSLHPRYLRATLKYNQ